MASQQRLYRRFRNTLSVSRFRREKKPRLLVVGIGGAGGNAVNNMIHGGLQGVEFCAMNTDSQALTGSTATTRLRLGGTLTRGLGAGARVDIGRAAAEESMDDIGRILGRADMVFITAGMGGGTGTGAAPVVAAAARRAGILTVGVVTKPFHFEGAKRARIAEGGIAELQQSVDTLIVIPNQNLIRASNELTTFADAFRMADDVLHAGVRGISDLITVPGLVNLDFADICTIMRDMGGAMMGTGEATDERRALRAAEAAICNPLLEIASIRGARGILVNFTGGPDMKLFEIEEAAERIRQELDPEANIIFGSAFDARLAGTVRVSVFATGLDRAVTQPVGSTAARLTAVGVEPSMQRDDAASALHELAAASDGFASVDDMKTEPDLPSFEKLQPRRSSSYPVIAHRPALHGVVESIEHGEEVPPPEPLRRPVTTSWLRWPRIAIPAVLVITALAAGTYGLHSNSQAEAVAAPPDTRTPHQAPLAAESYFAEIHPAKLTTASAAADQPQSIPSSMPSPPAIDREYQLQLGALLTEDAAWKEWERIRQLKIASFPGIAPSVVRVDPSDRGLPWRLRVGPIPDKDTATTLCIELQLHNRNCLLVQRPR